MKGITMAFGNKPTAPIAQKPPVTPVAPVTPTVVPKPSAPVAADPWADFGSDDTLVVNYSRGPRIDVEATTPAPIRTAVEKSLTEFGEVKTVGRKTVKAGNPKYRDQKCGTPEKAKELVKILKRYARGRKAGEISMTAFPLASDSTVVHWAATPKRTKTAKPKAATPAK